MKELNLHYNFRHGENCILKLSQITLKHPVDDVLFVTGATDGCIKVFSYGTCKSEYVKEMHTYSSCQEVKPSLCIQLHQSGVNALDVKYVESK